MPTYDLDRGAMLIDPDAIYEKYVEPVSVRIDAKIFKKMIKTVDSQIKKLRPSKKSQLTWTKCAALCGYQAEGPRGKLDELWQHASDAITFDPDGCNKFVGSLILWRIALLDDDIWLSTKTLDEDKIHPYRTYWINNSFTPYKDPTAADLAAKFNSR